MPKRPDAESHQTCVNKAGLSWPSWRLCFP